MLQFFLTPFGRVLHGIGTLVLGSGTGRLIGVLSIPILTRLYSPDDFGVLAVFGAFVMLLAPLATGRYVIALPLPRSDRMAFAVLVLSLLLSLGVGAGVATLLGFAGHVILAPFDMAILTPWWWLIALSVVGAATYEALTMWATRQRAYDVIAQTQIAQAAAGESLKIILGLAAVQPAGLLLGQLASYSGGLIRLSRRFAAQFRAMHATMTPGRLLAAAQRYREFPMYRLPAQMLLVFSMQAPLLFAAALYDKETTGQLGVAMMAMTLPFLFIGQATSRAFYGEVARARHDEHGIVRRITQRTMLTMLAVIAPLSFVLFLLGDEIFVFVLGTAWREAGNYASVLAVPLMTQFVSAPVLELLTLYDKQRVFIVIYGVRAAIVLASFCWVTWMAENAETMIAIYATGMTCYYAFVSLFILKMLEKHRTG